LSLVVILLNFEEIKELNIFAMKEGSLRGFSFSPEKNSSAHENKESEDRPEVLSGKETADLVEREYEKNPSVLTARLVNSNAVLTLAGLKGHTEIFIRVESEKEIKSIEEDIEKLNDSLEKKGIRFNISPNRNDKGSKSGQRLAVGISNLRGLERTTKLTKLPGVPALDSQKGFAGAADWGEELAQNFTEKQRQGEIPQGKEAWQIFIDGISKGYPDTAIRDFYEWNKNGQKSKMQGSDIPGTGKYPEAEPNYTFFPEHADEPAIRENIELAGQILEDFYNSDWHHKVSQNPEFKKLVNR